MTDGRTDGQNSYVNIARSVTLLTYVIKTENKTPNSTVFIFFVFINVSETSLLQLQFVYIVYSVGQKCTLCAITLTSEFYFDFLAMNSGISATQLILIIMNDIRGINRVCHSPIEVFR